MTLFSKSLRYKVSKCHSIAGEVVSGPKKKFWRSKVWVKSTFLSSLLAACFHIILPSKRTKCSLRQPNFQNFPRGSRFRRSFGPSPCWIEPYRKKTCLRACKVYLRNRSPTSWLCYERAGTKVSTLLTFSLFWRNNKIPKYLGTQIYW